MESAKSIICNTLFFHCRADHPIEALYPNPTTGKFLVTFSKALQNAAAYITDADGKTLYHFKASGNRVDFDLSKFSSGVYFVRLKDAGNIITKKVVKQ